MPTLQSTFGLIFGGRNLTDQDFSDIHKIPLVTPFLVGPVNAYFIEGAKPTLIDTGVNDQATWDSLEANLNQLGYTIRDIDQIFITHGHDDHFGLARRLADFSGAEVFVHEDDIFKVEATPEEKELQREPHRAFFEIAGVGKDILELMWDIRKSFEKFSEPLLSPNRLSDGETYRIGNRMLKIVHCPGHTPGVISLFDQESGLLFTGDHIIKHISPNPCLEFRDDKRFKALVNYLESIKKIQDLPVTTVLPGHGENIDKPHKIYRALEYHHNQRLERILNLISTRKLTIYELCPLIFRSFNKYQTFLAVSEIIAHLDLLELEGRVRPYMENGRLYYEALR